MLYLLIMTFSFFFMVLPYRWELPIAWTNLVTEFRMARNKNWPTFAPYRVQPPLRVGPKSCPLLCGSTFSIISRWSYCCICLDAFLLPPLTKFHQNYYHLSPWGRVGRMCKFATLQLALVSLRERFQKKIIIINSKK